MMKGIYRLSIAAVILMQLIFLTAACTDQREGFAVYLTADDVPVERMPVLSWVEPAAEPVISQDDIISYRQSTHEITLTPAAAGRLADMQFPVNGTSFLICVDKGPLYWGAFWPLYSSLSFDGVVIPMPIMADDNTIRIEPGYPSGSFFRGEDPRDNPLVFAALKEAGKLIP